MTDPTETEKEEVKDVEMEDVDESKKPEHAGEGEPLTDDGGILKKIIKEGDGTKPEDGFEIKAHYSGYLMDGTKFDSSRDRDSEFKFTLGKGIVVKQIMQYDN